MWLVTAVAVLAVSVFASPSSSLADTPPGEQSMRHGIGTVVIGNGADAVSRSVEVWAYGNAYRVVTSSLDGSMAAEEVVFDGKTQTAYVTDPAGSTSRISGVSGAHFAVPNSGSLEEHAQTLRIDWQEMPVDLSALEPVSVVTRQSGSLSTVSPDTVSGDAVTPASASICGTYHCYITFPNILDGTACVYAYNYRKTSNGYFRATSSTRGSCVYVDVTLWKGTASPYGCTYLQWLGSGPTASGFSSKYVYTNPTNMSPTCSAHAGWLSDWSLVVTWSALNTV